MSATHSGTAHTDAVGKNRGGNYLSLLSLGCYRAVIIFSAFISQHLGHCNGTTREVGVVIKTLTYLQRQTMSRRAIVLKQGASMHS